MPLLEFWRMVRDARLVLVLLTDDTVTAGLIVVTRSALIGSPVIASRTAATEGYFPPERADLLVPMFDAAAAVDAVRGYWDDPEGRRVAAAQFQRHVMAAFSPEAWVDAIAAAI